ncbi:MAG: TIGR03862 family flavoprotein [Microvirga sp.]|nr:TIGR03862 family flavoprotein [Microvirga sp.]
MIAAERLADAGFAVIVYERSPSVARKFLLAGRGGLNLTHSEPLAAFLEQYGEARLALERAISDFTPDDLRRWSGGLGQDTFVGSSGRVFPQAFKASPLLRAWLSRLSERGVTIRARWRWTGWTADGDLKFHTPEGEAIERADATLLALGGASWPRLGSDGSWVDILVRDGVAVSPLRASNVGFDCAWSEHFIARHAGAPLKRIALSFGDRRVRGEAIVTRRGIEGGAVYALSAPLRESILGTGSARLLVDLRPDLDETAIARKLAAQKKGASFSNALRKAVALDPAAIALLREAHDGLPPREPEALARAIKSSPLTLSGVGPIDRAISTAGGVRFDALDAQFMLNPRPGVFVAGEMLDWEAPTGGYLLQASFATGAAAAAGITAWLAVRA